MVDIIAIPYGFNSHTVKCYNIAIKDDKGDLPNCYNLLSVHSCFNVRVSKDFMTSLGFILVDNHFIKEGN